MSEVGKSWDRISAYSGDTSDVVLWEEKRPTARKVTHKHIIDCDIDPATQELDAIKREYREFYKAALAAQLRLVSLKCASEPLKAEKSKPIAQSLLYIASEQEREQDKQDKNVDESGESLSISSNDLGIAILLIFVPLTVLTILTSQLLIQPILGILISMFGASFVVMSRAKSI